MQISSFNPKEFTLQQKIDNPNIDMHIYKYVDESPKKYS